MRKFALINNFGERYDLNDIDKTGFLYTPEGLGYELETGYSRMGTVWISQYMYDVQKTISCSLLFGSESPYNLLSVFLDYIRRSEGLTLEYTIPTGVFKIDVDLTNLEKSEILPTGILSCGCTFTSTTLWYQLVSMMAVASDTSIVEGKKYAYPYEHQYNASGNGVVEFNNDGSVPSGFEVEFLGPISNPIISVTSAGKIIGQVVISGEADAGETIRYSSVDGNLRCELETDTGVVSLASSLDIENENFFKLPVGLNILSFNATGGLSSAVKINVLKQYRAV